MAKDSIIRATHIDWNVSVPRDYPTNKEYPPINLLVMEILNESNCNTAGKCDIQFDNTKVMEGQIKEEFIGNYIKASDTPDKIRDKKRPHKFGISTGVTNNNPNYPNNANEIFLGENHWVVAPCPPFCDLRDYIE